MIFRVHWLTTAYTQKLKGAAIADSQWSVFTTGRVHFAIQCKYAIHRQVNPVCIMTEVAVFWRNVAIFFATINVAGGFLVTGRMLKMFHK